jgi:hypothetical protein
MGRVKAAVRAARNRSDVEAPQLFPPGVFYSPVVNATELLREPDRRRVWPDPAPDPPGIDMPLHGSSGVVRRRSGRGSALTPLG